MNLELLQSLVILYVEDEKNLQDEVCQNLAPFVKKIIIASDGCEGFELYKEKKREIDIVVSDILMPNEDGISMVDNIRKLSRNTPVIYTTAFNDNDYLLRAIQQSVSGFILKPVDIELLLSAIENASVRIENSRLKHFLLKSNEELEYKVQKKTEELKKQNEVLYHQLHTDSLTNLLNRKSLHRDLEKLKNPALILIDIDAFKNINDIYGEYIGDLVLYEVASILKKYAKENEYEIYKIGADEFVLLKDKPYNKHNCITKVDEIIKIINNKDIYLTEYEFYISINITVGISIELKNTLESADMALKRAKKDRLSFLVYNEEDNINKEYEDDIKWTKIIERAIHDENVIAFFQPIVDSNAKIIKYESLIRIVDGEVEYSPLLFLDIAKKVKLYSRLERIMIQQVFEKVKKESIFVNINVSIEDIVNQEFIQFIDGELQSSDIAKYITFEILESESINDYNEVITFIEMVQNYGSKIAIDDFGSGYSNFSHLLKLNPQYIKIDGSLVKNIDKDKNSYIIVKTINDFAHALDIKTVAEYVHSQEVFEVLKKLGVDAFQGFYFGKPIV